MVGRSAGTRTTTHMARFGPPTYKPAGQGFRNRARSTRRSMRYFKPDRRPSREVGPDPPPLWGSVEPYYRATFNDPLHSNLPSISSSLHFQVLILLLLVVPALATGITLQMKPTYANEVIVAAFCVASTHAFIEFGCTLYFIKRYRLFILRVMHALVSHLPGKKASSTPQALFRVAHLTSHSTST